MKRANGTALTPAERRRLIELPFPAIRTVATTGKSWGGTYIADSLPTEGRRGRSHLQEDEAFYNQHGRD